MRLTRAADRIFHWEQNANKAAMAVAMYQARVSDLDPAVTVTVCCYGCDHEAEVSCREIIARLPGYTPVKDLNRHFRCENCGLKGQVVVDARRALATA
jgi:hypothetical protein